MTDNLAVIKRLECTGFHETRGLISSNDGLMKEPYWRAGCVVSEPLWHQLSFVRPSSLWSARVFVLFMQALTPASKRSAFTAKRSSFEILDSFKNFFHRFYLYMQLFYLSLKMHNNPWRYSFACNFLQNQSNKRWVFISLNNKSDHRLLR